MTKKGEKRIRNAIRNYSRRLSQLGEDLFITDSGLLTPINYAEEKSKFEKSNDYNPQFVYRPVSLNSPLPDINDFIYSVRSEKDFNNDLKEYFVSYAQILRKSYRMDINIGKKGFVKASNDLFSEFFVDLLSVRDIEAYLKGGESVFSDVLPSSTQGEENNKSRLLVAAEIERAFIQGLKKYNVLNFDVEIDQENKFTIRVSKDKIKIGCEIKRTTQDVMRLVAHEAESHVLQKLNGCKLKLPHLEESTSPLQVMFVEGLAIHNELQVGLLDSLTAAKYVARYLAGYHSYHSSFKRIYSLLRNYLDHELAFNISFRVKRGISNTAEPGGYYKDMAYLLGLMAVDKFLQEMVNGYRYLYSGKITPKEQVILHFFPEMMQPVFLPEFEEHLLVNQ